MGARQRGFTYVMVLVAVVVLGIAAGSASVSIEYVTRADREAELLYRGLAYQRAIRSYYLADPAVPRFPRSLNDLLADPRFPERHHIRELYADPVSTPDGGEWVLVRADDGGIAGVASASRRVPLKQGRFPPGLEAFEGAQAYADWQFEYSPPQRPK